MGLSSNAIIHLTKNKNALKGILKEGFRLSYCRETLILDGSSMVFYSPIVSFSDIPFSQLKDHIRKYGSYGIGMSKEWAEKQKLNPVLYVERNSILAQSFKTVLKELYKNKLEIDNNKKSTLDILRYMKNYQNDLVRGKKIYKNYRFSDEREWRYVLDYNEAPKFILGENSYDKASAVKSLESHRLEFGADDIKYIIIKSESQITEFINFLKNSEFPAKDVDKLITRIITADQIKKDF